MSYVVGDQNGINNPVFELTDDHGNSKRKTAYPGETTISGDIDNGSRCSVVEPMEDPPWQPRWWSYVFKYKWCPTFQTASRLVTYVLIGFVTWYILYLIVGETVLPPKGRLFQIFLLSASAMLAGWLVSLSNLPGLIGNLFIGALFQNCGIVDLDGSFTEINKFLRGVALIVILVRAGLGLDSQALRRLKFDILKLGLLPWLMESIIIGVLAYFLLAMPWSYGLALGFALSAISPAVTVPSLLRLKSKGYGISKGIPTLVMAITTLTDVFSVVCFGIIQSFIFSTGTLTNLILQLPVSIVGGIGFGLLWGFICSYCPESNDSFVVSLRILLTLAGGILSVFGSGAVGFGGAGPLACVVAPFVSTLSWSKQGWKVGENPVSISFKFLWTIFEPVLFAITGAQIKLYQLDGNVILIGTGMLLIGVLVRTVLTILLGIGSVFTLKEKIFCSMAMATKATVQAALAPVLIGLIPDANSVDYKHAEKVMMLCILSIVVTTPPLAIFMDVFGFRFLKRDIQSDNKKEHNSLDTFPANINVEDR